MKRSKVGLLALVATAGMTACDEGATAPVETLSQAEAIQMAQILLAQSAAGAEAPAAAATATFPSALVDFSEEVSVALPCEMGGTLNVARSVSGTTDTETGVSTFTRSLELSHSACGSPLPFSSAQESMYLDSTVPVLSESTLETDPQTNYSGSGEISGVTAWVVGERGGSCQVAFSFQVSGNQQAGDASVSITGSICSVDVTQQFSVTGGQLG